MGKQSLQLSKLYYIINKKNSIDINKEIGKEITVFQFELDKKGKLNKNSINNKYVMLRSGNKDSTNLINNDELSNN